MNGFRRGLGRRTRELARRTPRARLCSSCRIHLRHTPCTEPAHDPPYDFSRFGGEGLLDAAPRCSHHEAIVKLRPAVLVALAVTAHFFAVVASTWGIVETLPEARNELFGPEPLPEEPVSASDQAHARGRDDGDREARQDIARGVLAWRTYGYGLSSDPGYETVSTADVLASDFGVAIRAEAGGAGCIRPPDADYQRARRDAYNETMLPALQKRHGNDVLDVAMKRAERINAERRRRYEEQTRVSARPMVTSHLPLAP